MPFKLCVYHLMQEKNQRHVLKLLLLALKSATFIRYHKYQLILRVLKNVQNNEFLEAY